MREILLTSSVLILAVAALRRALRGRMDPRLQYALWLLVALRLLIPGSLFPSPVSVAGTAEEVRTAIQAQSPASRPQPEDTPGAAGPIQGLPAEGVTAQPTPPDLAVSHTPAIEPDGVTVRQVNWPDVLWKGGMVLTATAILGSNLHFCLTLRKKRRRLTAEELPVPCRGPVYLVEDLPSPCLFGLARPAIYVNAAALAPGRLPHILVHEETHRRHLDHLWAILRGVCLTIYWFDPLVWWAAALCRRDCELACDHSALRRLGEGERLPYGQTLLSMVAPGRPLTGLLRTATTMTAGKRTMKERLELIAKRPRMLAVTFIAVLVVVAAVVAVTFGGKPVETPDIPAADMDYTNAPAEPGQAPALAAEEAGALYRRAQKVWDWFELGTIPTVNQSYGQASGGYFRVNGFDSTEELRTYLENIFSPELTEHLLADYHTFLETDGHLYVHPVKREQNPYVVGSPTCTTNWSMSWGEEQVPGGTVTVFPTVQSEDLERRVGNQSVAYDFVWDGKNYVFTSFGPWDDVDPKLFRDALAILEHVHAGDPAVEWLPLMANMDWTALGTVDRSDELRAAMPSVPDALRAVQEAISAYLAEHADQVTKADYYNILSATRGLRGVEPSTFRTLVWQLYEANPVVFAQTVTESLDPDGRDTVTGFLAQEFAAREGVACDSDLVEDLAAHLETIARSDPDATISLGIATVDLAANAQAILDAIQAGEATEDWLPLLNYMDWGTIGAVGRKAGLVDPCTMVQEAIYTYGAEKNWELTLAEYTYILSATEGLDGAYSEGFSGYAWRLYENDPALFAHVVLSELAPAQRDQVLDFFRWELAYHPDGVFGEPISREEAADYLETIARADPDATISLGIATVKAPADPGGELLYDSAVENGLEAAVLARLEESARTHLGEAFDGILLVSDLPQQPEYGQEVTVTYRIRYAQPSAGTTETDLLTTTFTVYSILSYMNGGKMEGMARMELEQCAAVPDAELKAGLKLSAGPYLEGIIRENLTAHGLAERYELAGLTVHGDEPSFDLSVYAPGEALTAAYDATFVPTGSGPDAQGIAFSGSTTLTFTE